MTETDLECSRLLLNNYQGDLRVFETKSINIMKQGPGGGGTCDGTATFTNPHNPNGIRRMHINVFIVGQLFKICMVSASLLRPLLTNMKPGQIQSLNWILTKGKEDPLPSCTHYSYCLALTKSGLISMYIHAKESNITRLIDQVTHQRWNAVITTGSMLWCLLNPRSVTEILFHNIQIIAQCSLLFSGFLTPERTQWHSSLTHVGW